MNYDDGGLSGRIIGAAIEVHRTLGPGFVEAVYEEALCIEPREAGLNFVQQMVLPIEYRGETVGEHRLDLLVEKQIVVELKAITEFLPIHFSIMRSYLKAADCQLGLLLNFASPTLGSKGIGREWHSRIS